MQIKLPDEVLYIIDTLEKSGYEAFAVGGCIRDSLIGKEPQDWDICTSALPEQMMDCFSEHHVIETGLKHGTVTIVLNKKPFECTTYRVDGKYKDNRRPENVKFVNVLKRDLARRDFTINAMAYNPNVGLVDYYDGQQDLIAKQIKCVGNADKRFSEDALRIMRALRFASVFGFTIEENTAKAMQNNKKLLGNIAVERIATELNNLILGDKVRDLLSAHLPVIFEIIPELEPTAGFEQNNQYHIYDVLTHTLVSVDAAPKDLVLRLTMLLHDIGKPKCHTKSDDGVDHFYEHQPVSSDMAGIILSRLKYDKVTSHAVKELILYHDANIEPSKKHIKRWLNRIGHDRFLQLLEVRRADAMAQSDTHRQARLSALDAILPLLDEIILEQQCFSLKDLAIDGRDLMNAGITEGSEIGKILNMLVDMVIEEEVENEKSALLECIYKHKNE